MDIKDLVAQIVSLPRRFHSLGAVTLALTIKSQRQTYEPLSSNVRSALKNGSNTRKTNELAAGI